MGEIEAWACPCSLLPLRSATCTWEAELRRVAPERLGSCGSAPNKSQGCCMLLMQYVIGLI